MLAWIFFLLALRSYILAWQPGKSTMLRVIDVALGTFSLALFLLLPADFHWKPFVVIAAMIGISIYRRLSKPIKEKKFSLQTMVGWGCLYTVGAFVAISCTFFKLTEDKKVAKVILTGNTKPQWISWKSPSHSHDQGAWMEGYEVVVQDLKGKELSRTYVYGDLVGLRAEILTIHWPFHLLGFSNLCHLETLYNGYRTAQRHNFFPHAASALPFSLPFLQSLWEKLYHGEWRIPGVKTASLESAYLPLVTADLKPSQRSYWLVVGSSGLTSEIIQ